MVHTAAGRSGDRWRIGTVAVALVAVLVAVLAVVLPHSEGPVPIRLAAGEAGAAVAADEAAGSAADRADLSLWAPVSYRFELSDAVRLDAGLAPAWQLRPPSDLRGAAAEVARRFDLTDLRPAAFDETSLVAGPDDGTAPSLWIGPNGDWFYSAPGSSVLWDCAAPEELERDEAVGEGDGTTRDLLVEPCDAPTPPAGVPSVDEARSLAAELLAALAVPGEVVLADVHADEWSAWASAAVHLDGVPTDLSVHASWGGDAVLQTVNGTLATLERVDEYPTVDASAAVARLEEQTSGQGAPRSEPVPLPAEVTVADDPGGAPETVTVTLVSVEPVLQLHHDVDGAVWLLPGYRFTADDGGVWQVLAVADEYLRTDALPTWEEPLPVDPPTDGGGGTGGAPGVSEPGEPGTAEPEPGVDPGPGVEPVGDPEVHAAVDGLLGATEEEAVRVDGGVVVRAAIG
jgi:hypothetical protein